MRAPLRVTAFVVAVTACSPGVVGAAVRGDRAAQQTTQLISTNAAGEIPNGPSGHSVISNDKRYARAIAFESDASDIVPGDTNGQRDVFAVLRGGTFAGDGAIWKPGKTVLVSRTASGVPANGPSTSPSIDGAFQDASTRGPSCVGFLSAATNIVAGDDNGRVDAFVAKLGGGAPKRVSAVVDTDTTAVAVSGDCSLIATVTGDSLYVYDGKVTRLVRTDGAVTDPWFSVGRNQDLVFATPTGVWLLQEGKSAPKLIAPGGRNPSYNDVTRQVVAYEKPAGGHTQIMFRDVGKPEHVASRLKQALGDGDSSNPLIGNSGYAIAYQTDAGNLGVNALGRGGDGNGVTDVYLYTGVRDLTLLQSVRDKAVPIPAGGRNPGMSFYNNYITFDSAAPIGAASGPTQVFMRYLGGESASRNGEVGDLPPPVSGSSVDVAAESGTVLVRLPAGTSSAKARGLGLRGAAAGFVPLTQPRQVPIGSTFDTTRGRLGLFTAGPGRNNLQDGHFSGGMFAVAQGRKNPLTTLSMSGGGLRACGTKVPRGGARKNFATAAQRKRRLFSSVHGRFRTRGRNSSATVRGTRWTMTDTCAGTLTTVKSGAVLVRDFRLRKNRLVKAGKRYFARSRKLRKR